MRSRSISGSQVRNADRSQTNNQTGEIGDRTNQLFVLGIGTGSLDHLTKRAREVLASVDVVASYYTHIELIPPLIDGKKSLPRV